ncbi:unnamed protein product [Miscanthus lutarioriparius]|uniref:Uncharacterized protein n=1 Tax=Miscanthus lutarioriparius TaxID=422564 RepID=A0A811P9I5_9POAL|nr:unnamed protein product [Miscanthus lutarioriparius]
MAASVARHLFLAALLVAVLAVAAPRSADAWGGDRFFFSKTTRPEATVVEPEKAAVPINAATADTDAAPVFSRPSTAGSGRGYGLYGRPEENYPPDYFRRGVHRNAEKLTTTTTTDVAPATAGTVEAAAAAPVRARGAGGERVWTTFPENGSGRGRPPTDVPATTTGTEEEGGAGGDLDGVQPYPENGSGRGRPPWYYTGFHRQQEQRDYGMSDTRLYQNGRYYYDVDAGRYGYGRESNPMRTRPAEEEFGSGSGYGRHRGAGGRRDSSYQQQQQYGTDEEFANGAMDQNTNGFQEEAGQNGLYIP